MGEWREGLAVGLTHGVINVIKQNGKRLTTQVWHLEKWKHKVIQREKKWNRGLLPYYVLSYCVFFTAPVSACVWVVSGHRRKRRRCPDQVRGHKQTSGLSTEPLLSEYAVDLKEERKKFSKIWNCKWDKITDYITNKQTGNIAWLSM